MNYASLFTRRRKKNPASQKVITLKLYNKKDGKIPEEQFYTVYEIYTK